MKTRPRGINSLIPFSHQETNHMGQTLADDYAVVLSARAARPAAVSAVASAQSALTDAQAGLASVDSAIATAVAQVAADLAADGEPGFVANADGSITLLEPDANNPDFEEITVKPASALAGGAAQPPTPPPSS
jgi:hypothetical protein